MTSAHPEFSSDPGALVNLAERDPSIAIDIQWACSNNLLGRPLYRHNQCWLLPETAQALTQAQDFLKKQERGLKIWEGYRPMWAQRLLWEHVADPDLVSHPERGNRIHPRGAAVDVTLVDRRGEELPGPTGYCEFEKARQMKWDYNDLPQEILTNRALLEAAMIQAGFELYFHEWWHFNLIGWQRFPIIDEEILVEKAVGI